MVLEILVLVKNVSSFNKTILVDAVVWLVKIYSSTKTSNKIYVPLTIPHRDTGSYGYKIQTYRNDLSIFTLNKVI